MNLLKAGIIGEDMRVIEPHISTSINFQSWEEGF
jgi:hypothetical protein